MCGDFLVSVLKGIQRHATFLEESAHVTGKAQLKVNAFDAKKMEQVTKQTKDFKKQSTQKKTSEKPFHEVDSGSQKSCQGAHDFCGFICFLCF